MVLSLWRTLLLYSAESVGLCIQSGYFWLRLGISTAALRRRRVCSLKRFVTRTGAKANPSHWLEPI